MHLACPHCGQQLPYSGKRPSFCAYCGKSLPASEQSTVGFDAPPASADGDANADPSEVGGYRLLRVLGQGGMGRVYEAEEPATGRRVALKLISAEYAGSPDAVERFRREGRLASGVAHPRCVFVLAADESDGRPYIVMERMPGETLQDLVDRAGPLAPDQALIKILDVIDGLREAHRLGVVHRDVKPSNCFLEGDGRVKVGDFGLSKSLVGGAALTRTGSFLGTPLFASPEQIKGEAVGPQSDLYSVAATLYCLLTGRAPFQGGDPAATLARIVSDAPPPMRSVRPELPAELDRVVLRGLERDHTKRWRDLDEFRAALLPFLPGRLSIGGLGARFGAFLIDYLILGVVGSAAGLLIALAVGGMNLFLDPSLSPEKQGLQQLMGALLTALYFGGCEAAWGCTPGKRWLRLRVVRAEVAERPGPAAVALRTGLFYVLLSLGTLVLLGMEFAGETLDMASHDPARQLRASMIVMATLYPLTGLGVLLMLCTMRAHNGYRGLHEILSGTRVVRLPDPVRRRPLRGREMGLDASRPEGLSDRIGPFEIVGVLPGGGRGGKVLVGHDAVLGRRAWVWLRPTDGPALSPTRREVSRTSRLRWLAGGREGAFQWDAFLAPAGGLLADVVASTGRFSWAEGRSLIDQLAEELAAAEADGTLPATLTTGQVWVQSDGRVQLLDLSASAANSDPPAGPAPPSLTFLARTAVLALEGKPRPAEAPPAAVRAPLPPHASRILDRLAGTGRPYEILAQFRSDMAATAERPTEVTRPRRLAHLAVLTAFLSVGLCTGLSPAAYMQPMTSVMMTFRVREMEALRGRLDEVAARDALALQAAGPDERPAAARQVEEDARLSERLGREIERTRREGQARLDALNWAGRANAKAIEKQIDDTQNTQIQMERALPSADNPLLVRAAAENDAAGGDEKNLTEPLATVQTVMLVFWPAVWIVWAFLARGGLSYRLAGLTLVRGNGRPALRVQCAWRALLVWAPVVGLSLASVWLDAAYWSRWEGGGAGGWMLWASSAAWWGALALPAIYIGLALWRPGRAPHDWLAGTYLVPR